MAAPATRLQPTPAPAPREADLAPAPDESRLTPVAVRTRIGYGSPVEGLAAAHGARLGAGGVAAALGRRNDVPGQVPACRTS